MRQTEDIKLNPARWRRCGVEGMAPTWTWDPESEHPAILIHRVHLEEKGFTLRTLDPETRDLLEFKSMLNEVGVDLFADRAEERAQKVAA